MDIQSSFHMNDTSSPINTPTPEISPISTPSLTPTPTISPDGNNLELALDNTDSNINTDSIVEDIMQQVNQEPLAPVEQLDDDSDNGDDSDDGDNGDDSDDDGDDDEGYNAGLVNYIVYNLEEEQNKEKEDLEYHFNKQHGNWYYAKMIISHSWQDKNATEFFADYLDSQFKANNDCFENIQLVYYKNDLDIDIIYVFEADPGKHLVDNLRIPPFKPNGIIFNNPEDTNKWAFKIVVITKKGIYTANRYITDNIIGFY